MGTHKLVIAISLALFAGSLGAASAHAAPVLCQKGKKIKVREDVCRVDKGEVALDLGAFGLADAQAALEARLEARAAAVEAQVDSLAGQVQDQSQDLSDLAEMVDLVAVRQNHVQESDFIDNFSESDFTSVVGLGVRAPFDGFLTIWANLNAEYDLLPNNGPVDLRCQVSVDGDPVSVEFSQEFGDVDGLTQGSESVAITTVVPVEAGARFVDLECLTQGPGLVFMRNRSLTTHFVALEGDEVVVAPRPLPVPFPSPLPFPGPLPRPLPLPR